MDQLVNRMYIFIPMLFLEAASLDKYVAVVCEYDDADVIWPKFPINSTHIVESRVWFKSQTPIASWTNEKGFNELPDYQGRLKQLGESDITIKKATRSDTGTYIQILRLQSVQDTLNVSTRLHVTVVPSSGCKPKVTNLGQNLRAVLPSDDCVNSLLTLNWKQTDSFVMMQNGSSLLKLTPETKEHMVCAEGESAKCFQGNMSDLCTNQTAKEELQTRQNGWSPGLIAIAIVPVVLIVCGTIYYQRTHRTRFCRKRKREEPNAEANDRHIDNAENGIRHETFPLLEASIAKIGTCKKDELLTESIGLLEIKNYLQCLYRMMTNVPVSPVGEENFFSVSEVYIELGLEQIKTTWSENNPSVMTQSQQFPPIIIVGDNGIGKTTWCKHLVHCWSQHPEMGDAVMQCLHLPQLIKFEIVLYLSLKYSDHGLSFGELLQQSLFPNQSAYLEFVMKCINEKNHSQSILIVIDGLDKIGESAGLVSELLDNKLLSSCIFIFASRPRSFRFIFDRSVKLFEVRKMTVEKSEDFVEKVLMTINHQRNKDFRTEHFWMFTEFFHVQCLVRLPYLCLNLLSVWIEKKMDKENSYEITDILLQIINNLVKHAMADETCQKKISKLQQGRIYEEDICIDKLNDQPFKYLLIVASRLADAIFQSEMNIGASVEWQTCESLGSGKDKLSLDIMYEIGLITESLPVKSNEHISKPVFTDKLLYHFFVSIAITLNKGPAFNHIVSNIDVALKNSMIIHMIGQFSPSRGKDIFSKIGKLNNSQGESHYEDNKKCYIKYAKERRLITGQHIRREASVLWLQSLMCKGELDDKKLLFLTNALKYTDLLTILVLENHANNENLIFWLPCSKSLRKLVLNIQNCTLLLCPEWNKLAHLDLREIVIESVVTFSDTLCVLANAVGDCKKPMIKTSTVELRTDLNKILSPGSDCSK